MFEVPTDFASIKGYEDGINNLLCNPRYKKGGDLETNYIVGWTVGTEQFSEGYEDGINDLPCDPDGAIGYFNGWDRAKKELREEFYRNMEKKDFHKLREVFSNCGMELTPEEFHDLVAGIDNLTLRELTALKIGKSLFLHCCKKNNKADERINGLYEIINIEETTEKWIFVFLNLDSETYNPYVVDVEFEKNSNLDRNFADFWGQGYIYFSK